MTDTPVTDDYVAEILRKDAARKDSNRFVASGLGSLLSKPRSNAPKPNTRFLRNIVRDADSHNAALRRKEEEESRVRLRGLVGARQPEIRKKPSRDRSPVNPDLRRDGRPGRRWAMPPGDRRDRQRVERRLECRLDYLRSGSYSGSEDEQAWLAEERRQKAGKSPRVRLTTEVKEPSPKESRSRSRSRSRSPKRSSKQSRGKRQRSPEQMTFSEHSRKRKHRSSKDSSDSDPLEEVLGPKPPPKVLPRGRGAYSTSAMDARFEPNYDPKADVELEQDEEGDDWDMALEALRDRAKWRKSGAERLRAAGFSEEEVSHWEGGRVGKSEGAEKDISDVKWRKKGEGREWDRGKVVDGGRVDVKADWGRLKDT